MLIPTLHLTGASHRLVSGCSAGLGLLLLFQLVLALWVSRTRSSSLAEADISSSTGLPRSLP